MEVIALPRSVGETTETSSGFHLKVAPSAVVVVGYFLIGVVAYWPDYGAISQTPFVNGWDFEQSIWFLAWVSHSLTHGSNPFFSNALFVPSGVNLAQNTASPLLGWVTAPLSLFLNPIARANLLVVLAMPLSATSAFFVLRKWRVRTSAAAVGGFIFGFSAYMVDQNVELIILPLVPLIALVVVSIVRGEGSALRSGIQLGLLVTAQYLISPEILATVVFFALLGTAFVALRAPSVIVRRIWRPAVVAIAVAGLLLAFPIWSMMAGPQHFTGRPWPTVNPFHNDLLSFIVPGSRQEVSLGLSSIGDRLGGSTGATGAGGYIGLVPLAIAAFLAWRSRRRLRTQVAVVLMITAMILSLGPYLSFDGHQTGFPLPFLLFDHIPLLNDILPSRICPVTNACLAGVIAFGIDDLLGRRAETARPSRRRLDPGPIALFVAVLIGVLAATPPPQRPSGLSPPHVALPAVVRQSIPQGDPVAITYPYPTLVEMQPMFWQLNDDFEFRLLGGYAYHPDLEGNPTLAPALMQPPALQTFLFGQLWTSNHALINQAMVVTTRATLFKYDVRCVIVDTSTAGSPSVMNLFDQALGPPSVVKGSFSMWVGRHAALGASTQ